MNTCPYRAIQIFHHRPLLTRFPKEATTILTRGGYQEGINPPSYDKQFVRDWLEQVKVDGKPWSKTPPAPRLPNEVVTKTAAKYQEALARLTA